jgi:NAD(P)-dependent dehydrogenase (short-subunit alcohol dehydrogenase family)
MSMPLERRFRVDGSVAVVTGGGKGIGRAVCETLADAGAAVAVQDLVAADAERVAAGIRERGGRAIAVAGDAARDADLDTLFDRTGAELGGLDVLVNNAGIYPFTNLLQMPTAQWDQVLGLNLRGVFLATQRAGRLMAQRGAGGRIVNIASVQAFRPTAPGVAHYNVAKAGVVMLTKSAALELGPSGVAVNAVAPGIIDTPGTHPMLERNDFGDPKVRVPFTGRWGVPDDVANVVLFLASPAASYVSGETIVIDGGFLLQ